MVHKKQRIVSPHVAEPQAGTWSNCLRVGDVVYVAGMTARGADQRIEGANAYEQARHVFTKIRHCVEAAGGRMDDVVKIVVHVADFKDGAEIARARREFFSGDFPVSTLVQIAAFATPEILLEVDAVAHLGCSG